MDVRDNKVGQRFELAAAGATAFASYERDNHRIIFTHTVVPAELRGGGIGSRLIAGALALVREQGLKVVPQCPFVADYLDKHPEAAEVA